MEFILIKKISHYPFEISMRIGLSGDSFHFDEFQDGPARYNIIHFRRKGPNNYKWIRVGDYNEGLLTLNMSGNMHF